MGGRIAQWALNFTSLKAAGRGDPGAYAIICLKNAFIEAAHFACSDRFRIRSSSETGVSRLLLCSTSASRIVFAFEVTIIAAAC
jgi:hypothetical protein